MLRLKPLDPILEWRRAYPFGNRADGVIAPGICYFGSSEKSTTQTTNNTSQPWAGQQPFLTTGFNAAQNLLDQPAPQQVYPVAPFNYAQMAALNGIGTTAANGQPITGAATNFDTNLENGAYLNANPALGYFSSLAGQNLGLSNPGASILQMLGGSNPAGSAPGNSALTGFATGSPSAPGNSTLQNFANGGYFSNGFTDPTAQSIMSTVIPQIASQFNAGNNLNNPSAAYAASQGVTAALAPIEYQNYQAQEQLAQSAANTLSGNSLNAATGLNNGYFSGLNTQLGAGSSLDTSALAGGNLQATAASGISTPFQQTLSNMVQGNALAPQNQALTYADLQQLYNVGSAAQTQQQSELGGAAQAYNYSQLSPYQQLQAYMQAVQGNYGQTSTGSTTTPYFQNNTSNALGGAMGGLALASAFPATAAAVGGSGVAAGLGALLAFL